MENRMGKVSKIGIACILVIALLTACSVESRLSRSYRGKSFSEVMAVMGAPTHIENRIGGGTIRTYEKRTMLKEAPINTGQFQYDSFKSPKVLETKITQFFVDQDMIVTEIKYSCEFGK